MSILGRGAVGQQAGAGVLVRKAPPRLPVPMPPGGFPIDELPASPGKPPRGPLMLGPPEYYAALMGLLNVLTNRLKDNQNDEEDDKCKIYSYKDRNKECPGGRSHHIVPDRCWRSPGTRRQRTGIISYGTIVDQLLDKLLSDRGGGYYYANKMDDSKGQCICVSTEQQSNILLFIGCMTNGNKSLGKTQIQNGPPRLICWKKSVLNQWQKSRVATREKLRKRCGCATII